MLISGVFRVCMYVFVCVCVSECVTPPAPPTPPDIGLSRPQKLTEEPYEVTVSVQEAAILVHGTSEPKLTLKVTLTSLQMREESGQGDEGNQGGGTLGTGRCNVEGLGSSWHFWVALISTLSRPHFLQFC